MKNRKIKDVMVPLSDYATVSENDTLQTAIREIKKSQSDTKYKYKHRAVLVYNENGEITGKISFFDILKAIEPKYRNLESPERLGNGTLSRFGVSKDYLKSLLKDYSLWDDSLEELVKKASGTPIKNIMYSPTEGDYVKADSSLPEAVHRIILSSHQSLLVLENDKVVGILRLSDIFTLVCEALD